MRVVTQDLGFAYGRGQFLFRHLSIAFEPRQLTMLTGPSGSGKSTLLALLSGQRAPTEGSVGHVDDADVLWPPRTEDVVWVPQGANANGGRSVIDNVMIGALSAGMTPVQASVASMQALDDLGIAPLARRLARTLSGGELQRVSFARAAASGRAIILADEPTANLDRRSAEQLAAALRQLQTSATVVVATHDPALMECGDRIVDIAHAAAALETPGAA